MASASPDLSPIRPGPQGSSGLLILLCALLVLVLSAMHAASQQNEQQARAQFRDAVDRYQADMERQLLGYRAMALSLAAGLSASPATPGSLPGDRLAQLAAEPGSHRSSGVLGAVSLVEGPDARTLQPMRRMFIEPALHGPERSYVIMAPVDAGRGTRARQPDAPGPMSDFDATRAGPWVSVLLFSEALFREPIPTDHPPVSVRVVDLDTADPGLALAYMCAGHRGGIGARLSESRRLSVLGRTWQVTYETTPGFEATHRNAAPRSIAITGLLIGLAAVLAFLLRRSRSAARLARLLDDSHERQAPGPRTAAEVVAAVLRTARRALDDRAEQALRASESKNRMLAAVVEQTTAAVITKDLDNRITSWNRGAERLYGYSAAEAIGQLSHELLNPDITPAHLEGLLARIRGGSDDVNRLQHVRADGIRIDIESSHAPRFDAAGRRVGRITVIRDITEQLRAQRSIEAARAAAEQAQVTMSNFLANMSHELRTPMHAILSFARLAQDRISKGAPEKTLQYLDRIESSGGRLLGLLNDLLDLSRLEAGRMPIDAGPHELALTIDTALLEMTALARARELTVVRTGLHTLDAWYDPARIAQVLANMLGNAVKFSLPGGTITVSLGHATAADGAGMAEVVIADQGVGIPDSERETIFDKFTQSSTTRTGAGGTGLGLAISRELVLAHGGQIRALHNPGGGTRFSFTLPRHGPATERIVGSVHDRTAPPRAVRAPYGTMPATADPGVTAQDHHLSVVNAV
jgi:PAS domain S-box-containing protein